MSNFDETRRNYLTRWNALKTERSSWDTHWKEISGYLLPRSGRFQTTDRNRGDKRHNDIYDNTGTRSLRVLAAGMMSGLTSPARPWFRLATPDAELMEYEPVKIWLQDTTLRMRRVFAQSNTYRSLHNVYEELGAFGTASSLVLPNRERTIHHSPLTAGEFCIATDAMGDVTTLYREFDMTVSQLIREFGLENCSNTVKNLYSRGRGLDSWITVVHLVEPRYDRDDSKPGNLNMAFKSVYFELSGNHTQVLRESGFKRFPGIAPRWMASGGDIYGTSPAMECLGDVKQLQHQQLRKAEAIDYMTRPPLQAPSGTKFQDINRQPGALSFVSGQAGQGVSTLFETRLDLNALLNDIQDVRGRINGAFYADLFLMLQNDTRQGITATEIAERSEEKLLMLGPVLERLGNELLNPLIDITFEEMLAGGQLAPPPEELQGMDLRVEFVSTLAQAQRAVGLNSIDRLLGTIGGIAQLRPEVTDKLNADQLVDAMSDMLGVDPNLIVADEQVALIRKSRADEQARQQQAAAMPAMAKFAKDASGVNVDNAKEAVGALSQLTGYGAQ